MKAAVAPDVNDPSTWERPANDDFLRHPICPVCIVLVPDSKTQEHIAKRHSFPEPLCGHYEFDPIMTEFFDAPYRDQLAAIQSNEGWTPEVVERVLAVIYQYKSVRRVKVLASTWELAERCALNFHGLQALSQ